ncbi:hypothetical protein THASP1DRAFT_28139 [Thamnocephalis sphaerospora]|uniref:Probable RNA polymerase II nuclear localization protein SLC7A6OS n=1 Tax=Thamnocephalis sphaerospora TaxID=78915 RepID=A0A4P9XVN1_9FUNG|nr:hypothetical protein THASP1DRAFT_28139 [Thamnocephalis sphaerospora]|eukprot:RKP10092.1 hypothetical protein THASP1DRAFT_28139 [Thamnocephalis sphaerospora]
MSIAAKANQVTILRIKRKRYEDPVDALYVDTSDGGKKRAVEAALTSPRMFRLARSISVSSEHQAKRITKEVTTQLVNERINPTVPPKVRTVVPVDDDASKMLISPTTEHAPVPPEPSVEPAEVQPRFKVLSRNIARAVSRSRAGSREGSPAFQLYDAVREGASDPAAESAEDNRRRLLKQLEEADSMPDVMSNFVPLLRDHFTLRDRSGGNSSDDDGEYVYDFYYDSGDLQPSQRVPQHAAPLIWLDETDPNNVFFDDASDDDDSLGGSESEDSNAEDFYANDYPDEEEDSDEDYMPGEDSSDGDARAYGWGDAGGGDDDDDELYY